ncbi:MAG: hypothetical protein ACAI35_10830 [Candidatus Methylacidiphilales bacterium]|nr:hypothetical protein [Candidatus Methylacidiphilales bacterium]
MSKEVLAVLREEEFESVEGSGSGMSQVGFELVPQGGNKSGGAPVAMGFGAVSALAHEGATVAAGHFRVQAGFIDKDEVAGVPLGLGFAPAFACSHQVRSVAFDGVSRFFLSSAPGAQVDTTKR